MGPLGKPLTEADLQAMPHPKQKDFRSLLDAELYFQQEEPHGRSNDGKIIPSVEFREMYERICTRYDAKEFCSIAGMPGMFAFEEAKHLN